MSYARRFHCTLIEHYRSNVILTGIRACRNPQRYLPFYQRTA